MGKAPTNRASHTSKFILKTSPAALYPRVNIKINDYKLILIHAMGENNYEKRGGGGGSPPWRVQSAALQLGTETLHSCLCLTVS